MRLSTRTKRVGLPHQRGTVLEDAMLTTLRTAATICKRTVRRVGPPALFVLCLAAPAASQTLPPYAKEASLAGPRFGLTLLSDGVVRQVYENDGITVGPQISQFGWQFEKQFYTKDTPVTVVTEWVALLGGLEQSLAIPSLSWLVGVRTRDGAEFGIGPNVSPAGSALVLAAGMTFRAGAVNVPVNFAVVPSKAGSRVTLLTGFSFRSH